MFTVGEKKVFGRTYPGPGLNMVEDHGHYRNDGSNVKGRKEMMPTFHLAAIDH